MRSTICSFCASGWPEAKPAVVNWMRTVHLLLLFLLSGCASAGRADHWPRWRGPHGNAVSEARNLPLHWSTTDNVRWKTVIPGEGSSSPIAWDSHVFVTSALDRGK